MFLWAQEVQLLPEVLEVHGVQGNLEHQRYQEHPGKRERVVNRYSTKNFNVGTEQGSKKSTWLVTKFQEEKRQKNKHSKGEAVSNRQHIVTVTEKLTDEPLDPGMPSVPGLPCNYEDTKQVN